MHKDIGKLHIPTELPFFFFASHPFWLGRKRTKIFMEDQTKGGELIKSLL